MMTGKRRPKNRTEQIESFLTGHEYAFRAYADIFDAGRKIKYSLPDRLILRKRVLKIFPQIGSLAEMFRAVEESGAVIYGRDIAEGFKEDPQRTILLVSHKLDLSGAPIALAALARVLKKQGWQVVMISAEDGALGSPLAAEGIPAIAFPKLLYTDLIRNSADVFSAVWVNTIHGSPVVRSLEDTGKPVMWWIHEAAASYGRGTARATRRVTANNIKIFCVGSYALNVLKKRFPRYETEELLYCIRDPKDITGSESRETAAYRDGKKTFVCVGRIEPRKGQDILLEAISLLPGRIREDCRFILVGTAIDHEMKEQILQMQRANPGNIIYRGGLIPEELYREYRGSDFLVCPSRDDPMPIVAAEAMSLGKPVICSRNTGTAEIVDRYGAGSTYENNDPGKLARLIRLAYEMSDREYSRLSANARRACKENFSEEVFEKNIASIMERLNEQRHDPEERDPGKRYSADDHTFAVCAYKESPYLEDCLGSLMNQSVRGKLIICTSTPNAHIEAAAEKYGIPLMVNAASGGIGADWNFAYGCADTPLVTLAHQDDIYEPEFLEETLKSLNAASKPQIAMTCCYEMQNGRKVTHKDFINLRVKRWLLAPLRAKGLRSAGLIKRAAVSFANPVCCPSVTYVKSSLPGKLFDESLKYSVDWDAWIRLSRGKGDFVYIPHMLVGHRVYAGSSTMTMSANGQREKEDRQILRAVWPKPVAALIYRLYSRSVKKRMEDKN